VVQDSEKVIRSDWGLDLVRVTGLRPDSLIPMVMETAMLRLPAMGLVMLMGFHSEKD
jgi:hypothetical protein